MDQYSYYTGTNMDFHPHTFSEQCFLYQSWKYPACDVISKFTVKDTSLVKLNTN